VQAQAGQRLTVLPSATPVAPPGPVSGLSTRVRLPRQGPVAVGRGASSARAVDYRCGGSVGIAHDERTDFPLNRLLKNYLRCHCCVKNSLKMLIYNT